MSLDIELFTNNDSMTGICPVCGCYEKDLISVFEVNITHNLGPMADLAGIYEVIWRPNELGVTHTGEIISELEAGLSNLRSNPNEYRELNPANGWGSYEVLVESVDKYLQACKQYHHATIRTGR